MNGINSKKVSAAIAVVGSVAAIATVFALWHNKAKSPEARTSKLLNLCESAVDELDRRLSETVANLRQTA